MNRGEGICKLCCNIEQNRTHIFMNCQVIHIVYQHFSYIITPLGPSAIEDIEKAFGIYEDLDTKASLRNYITYTIRHIVFRSRNLEILPNAVVATILINKIKLYMKLDLLEKFYFYRHKHKLEAFKEMFLMDNILGRIENNELILSI